MAKQITNQKYIYKIHSTRFRMNEWSLNLSFAEAKNNEEVVPIGDSTILRMIRKIKKIEITEEDINKVKLEIKKLKNKKVSKENKDKISRKYKELENKILIDDYLAIIFDSIQDWKRANAIKYPIFFNGNQYVRLVGTNGGVKKNVVIFCKKDMFESLDKRLNNNRDTKKEYVPAKFESYKALVCSASTPVSRPRGVLIIKDGELLIKDNVLQLTDDKKGGFSLNSVEGYEIKKQFADGCGMINVERCSQWMIDLGIYKENEEGEKVAKYISSGFNLRNSWCKGMVFTFPFLDFSEDIAKEYMVEDAWKHMIDIRNVDLILTTNMVKLWDSYSSVEDYLNACDENDYCFSVAKVLPEKLEKVRNMNYQFLASYKLSDEDIKELIKPTVDSILDVISRDYSKTLLFVKGCKITEEDFEKEDYNFMKALMIEPKMMKDPFVKLRIYRLIEKRIKDSKKGVLQVPANYSIASGDLYALCQSMFKMPITGLLKAKEFYSYEWNNIKDEKGNPVEQVLAFRAPMSIHNNIRILNLKNNDEVNKWYRYMKTCLIMNAWDTTADAENGEDFDGDANILTNMPVLLRNTIELPTVICEQKTSARKKIKENLLRDSNKNGFYNNVGSVTNRCTGMYDVLATLEVGTPEYEVMMYRIVCMQGYQQEIIDSIKGIVPKEVPKHWYNYKELKVQNTDSEELKKYKLEQLRLASIKKPYFFIYNYSHVMQKYKRYIDNCKTNSLIRYGLSIDELELKEDKSEEEIKFLKYYHLKMPVSLEKSTMNRICWSLEEEYKDLKFTIKHEDFDKNILKSGIKYSEELYIEIEQVYNKYKKAVKQYISTNQVTDKDEKRERRTAFVENFKEQVFKICNNEKMACDILIDMCYAQSNKQFVWDVCGDVIVENLLEKNNYTISYPVEDELGDIDWNGSKFKLTSKKIRDIEEEDELC